LLVGACSSAEQPAQPEPAVAPAAADSGSTDPTGTWTGDWGPSERDRNNVTLELQWNGSSLTGTINPGQDPVQLTNTSYNPTTGVVTMEAEVPRGASSVHYTMEGKVEGSTMSGTWKHDNVQGDFRVTKS
jgi:hypothetical protein